MTARIIAAVLVALAIAGLARGRDADGDGVADRSDRCPATPVGDGADTDGCSPAQLALARGMAALLGTHQLFNVGTVWVAQRLARIDPGPQLSALIERSVAGLQADSTVHLIDPTAPAAALPADPGSGIMRFAHFVQAPIGEPATRAVDFLTQFLSSDETGYVLTHQLLALLWAADQGLALPGTLDAKEPHLLERLEAEQRALPAFNDLFAERGAFLLAFGAPPRAEAKGWVDTLVGAQQADGRWVDAARSVVSYDGQSAPAIHEWTHTTGLAVTALWFYTRCCAGDVERCGGADGVCIDPRPPRPTPCGECGR